MLFYSRNYLAILLELLLFRYLSLLPEKYKLAHYNYIKSKYRKIRWPVKLSRSYFASKQESFIRDFVLL